MAWQSVVLLQTLDPLPTVFGNVGSPGLTNVQYKWDCSCSGKESACQFRRHRRSRSDPWVGKSPCRKAWQPIPVFLPGDSPWTEDPGGSQVMGSQGVRQHWATEHTHARTWIRHKCFSFSDVQVPSHLWITACGLALLLPPLGWAQGTSTLSSHIPEGGREPLL